MVIAVIISYRHLQPDIRVEDLAYALAEICLRFLIYFYACIGLPLRQNCTRPYGGYLALTTT